MSKLSPIHLGIVKDGKIEFRDKEKFKIWIDSLHGKKVEVIVRKWINNRTIYENKYYWGVIIDILSNHFGIDPLDLHEALKLKFNAKIVNINDKEVRIGQSTANLKVKDFEDYLERIRIWAAENQIIIPLPNEVDISK